MTRQKEDFYRKRIDRFQQKMNQIKKTNRLYSAIRLVCFTGTFALFYTLLPYSAKLASSLAVLLFFTLACFMYLYHKNETEIKKNIRLIQINKNELKCLEANHNELFYNGELYKNDEHPYSSDLDIFGEHSLFHLVNRCTSKSGNDRLAADLSRPANKKTVEEKQKSIQELGQEIDWRQQLMQFGLNNKLQNDDPEFVSNWGKTPSAFYNNRKLFRLICILPACSLLALICAFTISSIPILILLTCHILIHGSTQKKLGFEHSNTSKRVDMLKIYANIIATFECKAWQSKKLKQIEESLSNGSKKTSLKIKKLSLLLNLLDQRYNIAVQVLFNFLFFYDLQLIFSIEKWKETHGREIQNWFSCIGEIEALSSFSNLHFNQTSWCFPKIEETHFNLQMKAAGHPLIHHKKRVCNNYEMMGLGMVHIITGSNMAGKSTFLRTVGINIVLALCGAPVCAESMQVSKVEVNTSMRIKDSLEENESSFYAELKRIRNILEKVNRKEHILLLLDEILRGTNSKDKHAGSVALIKQLIKQNAVALLATHDLELSTLEEKFPEKINNLFFDIKIDEKQLYFDYKVQNGICNTFNAPLLMENMGIQMNLVDEA